MGLKRFGAAFMLAVFMAGCATAERPSMPVGKNSPPLRGGTWTELLAEERAKDAYDDKVYACRSTHFGDTWKDHFVISTIILAPLGLASMGLRGIQYEACVASIEKPEGIVELTREEKAMRWARFVEDFIPSLIAEIDRFAQSIDSDSFAQSVNRGELFTLVEQVHKISRGRDTRIKVPKTDLLNGLPVGEVFTYVSPWHTLFISFKPGERDKGITLKFFYSSSGDLQEIKIGHPDANYYYFSMVGRRQGDCSGIYFATASFPDEGSAAGDPCQRYVLNEKERGLLKTLAERVLDRYVPRVVAMQQFIHQYERAKTRLEEFERELQGLGMKLDTQRESND